MMTHRFIVKPELCIGCRTCELACSFAHAKDGKQGRTRIFAMDAILSSLFQLPVSSVMMRPARNHV